MRRIAEQSDAPLRPVLYRLAIAEDPHAPGLDTFKHAQHLWYLHLEVLPHHVLAAFGVPSFLVVVGVEDRDEVVELAAAQRVVHEMRARAGPEHDIGAPQVLRDVLALEHGTIGDVPGHARLAVADDIL